ncbi:MAG: DJ-1/PfpI family protein [Bdellovibrionia bacterium]
MKIGLIAFDDFTDLDLILHWDLLNRVRLLNLHAQWEVRILGTEAQHRSVSGLMIPTSGPIEYAEECDAVLISSGIGTRKLLKDESFLKRLKLDPARQLIAAQCSGSLVLGQLGLLKNVKVSAYYPIKDLLAAYGAQLVNEALVDSRPIATASSCLAGVSLSDWIIKLLAGEEAATKVSESVRPTGL